MSVHTAPGPDPELRRMIPHEGPGTTAELFSSINLRGILDYLEAARDCRDFAKPGMPGLVLSPTGQALLVEAVTRLVGHAVNSPAVAEGQALLRGPEDDFQVERGPNGLIHLWWRKGDLDGCVNLLNPLTAHQLGRMLLDASNGSRVQAPASPKAPLLKAVEADADTAGLAERAARYLRHWMELVPATSRIKGPNPLPELLVAMAGRLLPRSSRGGSIEDDELAGLLEVLRKRRDDAMRDYLGSTGEEVRERYWGEAQAFRAAIDLVSDIPRHRPRSAAVAAEVTT